MSLAANSVKLQPFTDGICWGVQESRKLKINGHYYREVLLKTELLPDMTEFSDYYTLQHVRRLTDTETIDLLANETPDFISPTLCPPNSPDLNPVDYKIWSVMQETAYRQNIRDVDEFRERIVVS